RTDQAESTAEAARRSATVHGGLALAVLGRRWYEDPALKNQDHDPDRGDYRKTREQVDSLPVATKDPADWSDLAARLGERIGRGFTTLAVEIAAPSNEERGITDLSAFQSRMARADRLARLVLPGDDLPSGSSPEPSSWFRRARVHDFLEWMAERAWLDHWYDE